jgi:hypothetical protein
MFNINLFGFFWKQTFAESNALFAPTFKGTKIMKIENKLCDGEHLFMMTALYNNF